MKMKKIIALICLLCMAVTLFAGCGDKKDDEGVELLWYVPGDVQPDQ